MKLFLCGALAFFSKATIQALRVSFPALFVSLLAASILQTSARIIIEDLSLQDYTQFHQLNIQEINPAQLIDTNRPNSQPYITEDKWTLTKLRLLDGNVFVKKLGEEGAGAMGLDITDNSSYLEPGFSIAGMNWGTVSRNFTIPENCQLTLQLSILLQGYKENSSNTFLRTSPELELFITRGNSNTTKLLDLHTLNHPPNRKWKDYKTTLGLEESGDIQILLRMERPSEDSHILLRRFSVGWTPLVEEGIVRTTRAPTTTTLATTITSSTISTISTTQPLSPSPNNNNTTDQTTTLESSHNSTDTTSNSSTTLTPTSSQMSTTSLKFSTTSSGLFNTSTFPGNSSEPETLQEAGNVGYAGEIVLIVLVILFGLAFVAVVIKYVHLQKNIGESYTFSRRE